MPASHNSAVNATGQASFGHTPSEEYGVHTVAADLKNKRAKKLGWKLFSDRADMAETCYDFLRREWFSREDHISLNDIRRIDETLYRMVAGDVVTVRNFYQVERKELSKAERDVCRTVIELDLLNKTIGFTRENFESLERAIALTRPQQVTAADRIKNNTGMSRVSRQLRNERLAELTRRPPEIERKPAGASDLFYTRAREVLETLEPAVSGLVRAAVGERLKLLASVGAKMRDAREGHLPQPLVQRVTGAMEHCVRAANSGHALPDLPREFVESAAQYAQGQATSQSAKRLSVLKPTSRRRKYEL